MPRVHRLPLPTPFPVGPVNAYLLVGDPLTVVDPGPVYAPAREALVKGLGRLGFRPRDLERIFLTHPHVDHYGLAGELAAESGAEVAAAAVAAARLGAAGVRGLEGEREAIEELLARSGAPEGFSTALFESWSGADVFAVPVKADLCLAEGDVIEGGGVTWRVLHTPGHSPASLCFLDEAGGRLLSGDTLLPHISSNALVDFRRAEDGRPTLVRERSLEALIASLRRLADLELREVLPGHGEPFGGHRSVVDERLRHHERRKETVAEVLRGRGPCPAFQVALALFPEQGDPMGRFLALSEVLGHLDLLEADGVVRRHADGGVDLYSLA